MYTHAHNMMDEEISAHARTHAHTHIHAMPWAFAEVPGTFLQLCTYDFA